MVPEKYLLGVELHINIYMIYIYIFTYIYLYNINKMYAKECPKIGMLQYPGMIEFTGIDTVYVV